MLLQASYAGAQAVTDPMITKWWFNTTNNKYNNILTDVEAVYYTTSIVYVKTSGVPNYYKDGVSHNNAKDLQAVWSLPRTQTPASSGPSVPGGQMGIMYDGSVFFHPGDAQSYNLSLIHIQMCIRDRTQSVQNMVADGAAKFTEVGPGNVLQGLVKKIAKEVETAGIN